MQLNNLEKLYEVMKYGNSAKFGGEIELSESLIIKARQPLVKMLEMS
jgi:quinolinate synthase